MLKISDAAKQLGVHQQTLRRWEREGKIKSVRFESGYRRYELSEISRILNKSTDSTKSRFIYCRVSSKKQENDLRRQIQFMEKNFPDYQVISDIGSGVNFNRPGLQKVLEQICKGNVQTLAISYKDRLCRIGFEIFAKVAQMFGCKIIIINNIETSPEKELVEDLIAITTSFSARIHGLRKYSNKMQDDKAKFESQITENPQKVD